MLCVGHSENLRSPLFYGLRDGKDTVLCMGHSGNPRPLSLLGTKGLGRIWTMWLKRVLTGGNGSAILFCVHIQALTIQSRVVYAYPPSLPPLHLFNYYGVYKGTCRSSAVLALWAYRRNPSGYIRESSRIYDWLYQRVESYIRLDSVLLVLECVHKIKWRTTGRKCSVHGS